jgi:hypothetical protein
MATIIQVKDKDKDKEKKGLVEPRPMTSSAIEDLLFYEMRSLKPISVVRTDLVSGEQYKDNSTNKYDYEADTHTNRLVFGDFSNPTQTPKPVFRLDCRDFSAELKENLVERVKCSKDSIHRVVQNAVYRIIKARHPDAYLEHIKDKRLNWRFV